MPEALVTRRKPAIGFGLLGFLASTLAISAAAVYIHATYSRDRMTFAQHGLGSAGLLRIEVDCSGPGGIGTPPTRGKIDLGWISREGLVTIQAQLGGESPRLAYRVFVNGRVAAHYGNENNLNNTAGLGGGKSTGEIVYARGYSAVGQDRGEIGCGPPNATPLPAAVEKADWIRGGSAEAELFSFGGGAVLLRQHGGLDSLLALLRCWCRRVLLARRPRRPARAREGERGAACARHRWCSPRGRVHAHPRRRLGLGAHARRDARHGHVGRCRHGLDAPRRDGWTGKLGPYPPAPDVPADRAAATSFAAYVLTPADANTQAQASSRRTAAAVGNRVRPGVTPSVMSRNVIRNRRIDWLLGASDAASARAPVD